MDIDIDEEMATNVHRLIDYHPDFIEATKKKLKTNVRSRISGALTHQGMRALDTHDNLLGCDIPTLARHLEDNFTTSMTWYNYGERWLLGDRPHLPLRKK